VVSDGDDGHRRNVSFDHRLKRRKQKLFVRQPLPRRKRSLYGAADDEEDSESGNDPEAPWAHAQTAKRPGVRQAKAGARIAL